MEQRLDAAKMEAGSARSDARLMQRYTPRLS